MNAGNYAPLLNQLNAQTLILTPNQHLAYHLTHLYESHLQKQTFNQFLATEKTPVYAFTTWLNHLFNALDEHHYLDGLYPLLLNSTSLNYMWEISVKTASNRYIDRALSPELATEMLNAWQLCLNYQVPYSALGQSTHENHQLFFHTQQLFTENCKQYVLVDPDAMSRLLLLHLPKMKSQCYATIILVGFQQIPPLLHQLLQVLEKNGSRITRFSPQYAANEIRRCHFANEQQELIYVAQWAQQAIDQGHVHIGCLIPSLTTQREEILDVFTQHCENFSIAIGKALASYPLIDIGLKLLSITRTDTLIETNLLSQLFRSSYLDFNHVLLAERHIWAARIEQTAKRYFSLNDLHQFAKQKNFHQWASVIEQWIKAVESAQTYTTLKECIHHFAELLTQFAWGNTQRKDSAMYQLYERFYLLFKECLSLNYFMHATDVHETWRRLKNMACQTIFQPKQTPTKIQISNLIDAIGLNYEKLWISQLHTDHWPIYQKPSPFIPITIQKKFAMPHASAEIDLAFSKQLLQNLVHSAADVQLSYAQQADERILQISPLIVNYPEIKIEKLNHKINDRHDQNKAHQPIILETLTELYGPAVSDNEVIKGGISILQQQAACPFKAFAHLRLKAEQANAQQLGLLARDRGTLVHDILHRIWTKLESQDQLNSLTEEQLKQLINEVIDQALTKIHLPAWQKSLETQHLLRIIKQWLEYEKSERHPFSVIACEKDLSIQLGKLTLNTRIDRIDQYSDGSLAIIDYKTGTSELKECFGVRPQHPQLPVYSAFSEQAIDYVYFGKIQAHEFKLTGIGADHVPERQTNALKKFTDASWDEQLTIWRTQLTALADEFMQGYAAIAPFKAPLTCQICDLKSLCRIDEKEMHDDDAHDSSP